MPKRVLHYTNTGKSFYDFENVNFPLLKDIKTGKWNVWRIVKTNLFFHIIYSNNGAFDSSIIKKEQNKFNEVINWFFSLFKFCIKLIYTGFTKRSKSLVLFITLSANKTYINKRGKAFDIVVDYFIDSGIVKNYCYIEIPDLQNRHLKSAVVKRDFLSTEFFAISGLISRFVKRFVHLDQPSDALTKLFNDYYSSYNVRITSNQIKNILISFWVDYYLYWIIFKVLRPKLIIFNDQMALGRMAAAKSLKIETIEMQHGLMDEYYPQYHLHSKFKEINTELPLSSKIAVFGNFHKNQLMAKGFYEDNDIFVLGKFGVEVDSILPFRFSENTTILFITQGSLLFEQSKRDIETIIEKNDSQLFFLVIKIHPLEPPILAEYYYTLQQKYKNRVKVIQNEYNISYVISACDYIVGYNSTVLLEAIHKGKIVFSLADETCPNGIFSVIGQNNILLPYIIVCNNCYSIFYHIQKHNIEFRGYLFDYLFDKKYKINCKRIINEIIHS